jgi:hypothetical protein
MQPEEINVIRPKPLQTSLQRTNHAFAMITTTVWVTSYCGEGVFCSKDELIAVRTYQAANDSFASSIRVTIGCIDEVTTAFHIRVEDRSAFFLRSTPTPILTKRHGTEA